MNPRQIDVHIEELVLHGFAHGDRWDVADAIEHELRDLLAAQGIPKAWQSSPDRIDTGAVSANTQSRPAIAGEQIARAVYQGPAR